MADESILNYWRDDFLFGEHHEHWHFVYPYSGTRPIQESPSTSIQEFRDSLKKDTDMYDEDDIFIGWNDRHGELFAYMHSQMLARYSAERSSHELDEIEPLSDYRSPIPEEFVGSPFKHRTAKNEEIYLASRPANKVLEDMNDNRFLGRPGEKIHNQEIFRDRLQSLVNRADFRPEIYSLNELAERIEPTGRFQSPHYGAYHNDGHILLSLNSDGHGGDGPLLSEATAIKDPIFYRWHKHIDSFFTAFQNRLEPYGFGDLPAVKILQASIVSGKENEVRTVIDNLVIDMGALNRSFEHPFIDHSPYKFSITTLNKSDDDQECTFRIFICPEEKTQDRSSWIEMDKAVRTLHANQTETFEFWDDESSVVRKPAIKSVHIRGEEDEPFQETFSLGCKCGWPYTMLLPRGKTDGMLFKLFVIVTFGSDLASTGDSGESYCGKKDSNYPDIREMGYPFNRPMSNQLTNILQGSQVIDQIFIQEFTIVAD